MHAIGWSLPIILRAVFGIRVLVGPPKWKNQNASKQSSASTPRHQHVGHDFERGAVTGVLASVVLVAVLRLLGKFSDRNGHRPVLLIEALGSTACFSQRSDWSITQSGSWVRPWQ